MKTIILCGGYGSRLKEETEFKPKPMIEIGGKPIVWHIMKIYCHHNFNKFILALGYKGNIIKDYFLQSHYMVNDFRLNASSAEILTDVDDNFDIIFSDTGLNSLTGERILKLKKYITEDNFMVTYGDGVADVDISALVKFHKEQNTMGTITGVHPHSKYGLVKIDNANKLVMAFEQKPLLHDYVSGGFMVFKKEAMKYFDEGIMENGLMKMAEDKQLSIYCHDGFWQAMDTYYEMEELNKMWAENPKWKIWS